MEAVLEGLPETSLGDIQLEKEAVAGEVTELRDREGWNPRQTVLQLALCSSEQIREGGF